MAKINGKKLYGNQAYTIAEIAEKLLINPKTTHRWIDAGLEIVSGSKNPILIMGFILKNFLTNRRQKRKIPIKRTQFCCFKCKAARYAKRGSTKIVGNQKKALCRVCNGKMCRTIQPGLTD